MILADIEKIYSNDYVDLIIGYYGDLSVLEQYQDSGVQIINFFLAVVHLPVGTGIETYLTSLGYSALPSVLGLTSEASLEASGVVQLRNVPAFNLRGKGVLMGIIDTGIDYTNPIFQNADKTTRIATIWDQTIISENTPEGFTYGTEYTREQINEALSSENPFLVVPSRDEIGHGTMIAGIAAGNDVLESGFSGVAPDTEFVIVKLKPAKQNIKQFFRISEDAVAYQENDLLFAYQYLFDYAAKVNKPLVICSTIDTSQYAHDGRGTTSGWLSLQASITGTAILVSAGNEGNARRHFQGIINDERSFSTVELNVGANETGFSMELWGTAPNLFTIDITSPTGEYVSNISIQIQVMQEVRFIFEPTNILIFSQISESQSGDQLIFIRFTQPTQGIWRFNVYSRGVFPINFHIWLPMNGFISTETFFLQPDPNTSLLTIACAQTPITVTAYNTVDNSLYIDAGRGYTRINVIKPDIAAPGVNVLSPSLNQGFEMVTGTGAATAHTAGVAAMLFEWGIVNGNYPRMNTQDMKIFLIRGARRMQGIVYPNPDWGFGRLDIYNTFNKLRGEI